MALMEGSRGGSVVQPRRRRRPSGPPDPISMALAQREEPQEPTGPARPMGRTGFEFGPARPMGLDDEEPEEEGGEEETLATLLAMLQGDDGDPRGDTPEYGPLDEEGAPWGMDTDPEDAQVLRNLLAMRRRGLQEGRYPLR